MSDWEDAPTGQAAQAGWEDAPSAHAKFMAKQTEPDNRPWWQRGGAAYAQAQQPYKSPADFARETIEKLGTEAAESNAKRREEFAATGGQPPVSNLLNTEAGRVGQSYGTFLAPGEGGVNSLRALQAGRGAVLAPTTPAQIARAAGYVLPPAMVPESASATANILAGWAGKIKTQQLASVKNQPITNRLAAQELGLPGDALLTESTFKSVRGRAAQTSKAVIDSGVPMKQDMAYIDDLLRLGPSSEEMAKYFPETAKNDLIKALQDEFGTGETFSAKAGIEAVRRLRAKATDNLRDMINPDKRELGFAQRGAADAIERLIERNLDAAGKPDLMAAYRDARKLIAKSHDIEAATNMATGDVDARVLANLQNRGRPLTNNLRTIANTAEAFPAAMRDPSRFGGHEPLGVLDMWGGLIALGHGHVPTAAMMLTRPMARIAALSNALQNRIAGPKTVPPPNSLLSILQAPPATPGPPSIAP